MVPETNVHALNQTLSIAYYNIAVEYEYVKQYPEAMQSYQTSIQHTQ